MKIQKLYAIAGLVWGFVLAPQAGLSAAGVMGRVAWLYSFRDGAWANWFIAAFGIFIGLFTLATCIQLGSYTGWRYADASEQRRKHVKAIPWALIVVGITVGVITMLTLDDRQRAIFAYLQKQQEAAGRLLEMARNSHRITNYGIDWPGGNEAGRLFLSFDGDHQREYVFDWAIFTKDGKTPLLGDSYQVRLGAERKNTDIPISQMDLGNAWLKQTKNPQPYVDIEAPFRLVMTLTPMMRKEDWEQLPENEDLRLKDGESILIRRLTYEFKLKMRVQGGRVEWLAR